MTQINIWRFVQLEDWRKDWLIFFWNNISECLLASFLDSKEKGILSNSQKQAVIKLLEKKDKDKRYIENWRLISLINYDAKLLSKALAERLKLAIPSIIKNDQTAYVKNRFLGESVRLISDILEITQKLKIEGYIMTIDIEKLIDEIDEDGSGEIEFDEFKALLQTD